MAKTFIYQHQHSIIPQIKESNAVLLFCQRGHPFCLVLENNNNYFVHIKGLIILQMEYLIAFSPTYFPNIGYWLLLLKLCPFVYYANVNRQGCIQMIPVAFEYHVHHHQM